MKLKIKSDKNIQCNDTDDKDIHRGDMDFAERISKYDDIRIIEFNHNVYILSWTDDLKKYNENKKQRTYVKGDTVHIDFECRNIWIGERRWMEDNYDKFSEKKLLTVKQMCEYMSIGESTARKMLSEPNCTFVCRIGGRIYANRTMLDKYIDANTGRKGLSGFIKK